MDLLAILEYDGTDFAGFQVQGDRRTVQGVLEQALARLVGKSIRIIAGGRTDAGVHALGQTASFTVDWNGPEAGLLRGANALLPNDVALVRLFRVPPGFSARYSAQSRSYRYTILNRPQRAPMAARYSLQVIAELDLAAMQAAARELVGEHDFRAFGRPPQGKNTIRELRLAQVQRFGDLIYVDLTANAFLNRMARRIVGTLLLVGQGQLAASEIKSVLEGCSQPGQAAKPHGLCLMAVEYGGTQLEVIG